jgi:hypothetical protein
MKPFRSLLPVFALSALATGTAVALPEPDMTIPDLVLTPTARADNCLSALIHLERSHHTTSLYDQVASAFLLNLCLNIDEAATPRLNDDFSVTIVAPTLTPGQ